MEITLPPHVEQAVFSAVQIGRRFDLHPVDIFGEVAELIRNVDTMDEYAEAIEARIAELTS